MRHSRTAFRPLLRLSGLAAAGTAGLIVAATAAGAATTAAGAGTPGTPGTPGSPVISAAPNVAAAATAPQTVTEEYGCDTSELRPPGSTAGLGDLNINVTLSAPATGIQGKSVNVSLTSAAVQLSPAIGAVFPAVDSMVIKGTAPVNATAGPGVTFSGSAGPIAAHATQLPATTATVPLPLTAVGTTTIHNPQIELELIAGGKTIVGMSCEANEGTLDIAVTAASTPPPVPVPPAGPSYTCTVSGTDIPTSSVGSGPIPFVASVAGGRTTGSTDVVSVGLPPAVAGALGDGFGGSDEGDIAGTVFAASLPVTGPATAVSSSVVAPGIWTAKFSVDRVPCSCATPVRTGSGRRTRSPGPFTGPRSGCRAAPSRWRSP